MTVGATDPARTRMTAAELRGMIAAIADVSIFAFSLSLSIPLIAINLERMGASGFLIGMNSAGSAVAILLGGFIMPPLLRRIPAPVMMTAGVLSMTVLMPVFPAIPDPYVWIGLRFLFGTMVTALFFCSELWIITSAPPARRGFMIGIYGLFLSLGFLAGPLLLQVVGTEGVTPFYWGAGLALLALPPIFLAWRDAPHLAENAESAGAIGDILGYFRTDPAILWAVVLFGVMEFGAMGLFPVWSLRVGLEEATAITLVAMLAAGNVVTQIPMGWIGDRFDRRRLLGLCALICVIAALVFPHLTGSKWALWITAAAWGGLVVGLYTFSLNELGSRYSGEKLAQATGAVMTAYGLGALVSPPVLGAAMDAIPPHGMFWLMALASFAYLMLLMLRKRRTA